MLQMKIEFHLSEDDYLTQMLFNATQSKVIKRRRLINWLICIAMFLILALTFYLKGNYPLTIMYVVGLIIFIIFYPMYQRWLYKRSYSKYLKESMKNKSESLICIEFIGDQILLNDYAGDASMNISAIDHIYETGQYFYLRFNSSGTLILPKAHLDVKDFTHVIQNISEKYNIPFKHELNWKWK